MNSLYRTLSNNKTTNRVLANRGLATIEALPILIVFVMLLAYGMGMFGVVHTGILNSIAGRTYAFETFTNRTDLTFFRDTREDQNVYFNYGFRFHGIQSDQDPGNEEFLATVRPLSIGRPTQRSPANALDHNQNIYNIEVRNREGGVSASPIWLMIGYGICLNTQCGG